MTRALVLAGAVLAAAVGLTRAAEPAAPSGSWKLTIPNGKGEVILLLKLEEKDGKWSGAFVSSLPKFKSDANPKFTSLKVAGDSVQFTLELEGQEFVSFDGVRTKDNKKIAGSMSVGGSRLILTELNPTKLKSLDDPFDILRELAADAEGSELFDVAFEVFNNAAAKKVSVDDVRVLLDRVNKTAAAYGPRWEREMAVRTAGMLASQTGFADLAVAQAKRAERLLTDDDALASRMAVLEAVVSALEKAGKAADAKTYQAQLAKLEARDYVDFIRTMPFKTAAYAGRKGKSDRTVLVELFTTTEVPNSTAADLACDALLKTYRPAEVVVLDYHLHVQEAASPDVLTCPDAVRRVKESYAEQLETIPMAFVNGKTALSGGGLAPAAEKKYEAYRAIIDASLETPAGARLGLALTKAEKGYTATAKVDDLVAGDKISLRFVLAEERVRYAAGSGPRYHHMIVRAMPGGAKGFPLTKRSSEQNVSFNPDELRAALAKHLEDADLPHSDNLLQFRNLKLVAFVQNDATREVLQAIQVDVDGK